LSTRGQGGPWLLQLLHLEHDHGFVDGLEQGVGEAGTALEETALEKVEQQKLDQGPSGQAVEELLLVEAAAVEVALEKGGRQGEGSWVCRFWRVCWALNERKG